VRIERSFVGLDVHAWSVTGHGLDAVTGEIWQRKLTPDPVDVEGWLRTLPQPVAVTYEAGPTGFGLARHRPDPRRHHATATGSAPPRQAARRGQTRSEAT
jgi:hypothetical protein